MKNEFPSAPTLYTQLLHECQIMTEYALASGMAVSEKAVQTISDYARLGSTSIAEPEQPSAFEIGDGKAQEPSTSTSPLPALPGGDLKSLAATHQELAELVKPATPRTLILLAEEAAKGGWTAFLGPIPLVRRLMVVALCFLVLFVAVSLSSDATGVVTLRNSGSHLLLNELLFLAAAGLGAIFATLFKVNDEITTGSYDPRLESGYWIKIVLGLVAGLLLALLVPLPDGLMPITDSGNNAPGLFAAPLIALLGGFSAEVLLHILNRLIKSLESLVSGTAQEQVAVREKMADLYTQEALLQERLTMVTKAIALQQQLPETTDTTLLKTEVNQLLGTLIAHSMPSAIDSTPQQNGVVSGQQMAAATVMRTHNDKPAQ